MAVTPRIFISATSGDLRSHRALVSAALKKLETYAEVQDDWPHDYHTVAAMLRRRIRDSDAVIHLAGLRYGVEPADLPPGVPRRSYTQMEYHLARVLKKPVYLFLLPDTFPYDDGALEEDEEKRALQQAHRDHLAAESLSCRYPADAAALEKEILLLYPQMEKHRARLHTQQRQTRVLIASAAGVLCLAGGITGLVLYLQNRNEAQPAGAEDSRDALKSRAEVLLSQGRHSEAESHVRRALALDEAAYGRSHPGLTASLNTLAIAHIEAKRYAEAESLLQRIMEIDDKAPEKDPAITAVHLNTYAQLLQRTDRKAEAGPFLERALRLAEKQFGPGDPRTAAALNSLGHWHSESGRYGEAGPLLRQAVALGEKQFGPEHPTTAIFMSNLGGLLWSTESYAEAEALMKRAIAIGERDPATAPLTLALRQETLGMIYAAVKQFAEAETCSCRSLPVIEKSCAAEPEPLAKALFLHGRNLRELGRLEEAEPLLRKSLSLLVSASAASGRAHPMLMSAAANYGRVLQQMGETREAIRAKLAKLLETPDKQVPEFEKIREGLLGE